MKELVFAIPYLVFLIVVLLVFAKLFRGAAMFFLIFYVLWMLSLLVGTSKGWITFDPDAHFARGWFLALIFAGVLLFVHACVEIYRFIAKKGPYVFGIMQHNMILAVYLLYSTFFNGVLHWLYEQGKKEEQALEEVGYVRPYGSGFRSLSRVSLNPFLRASILQSEVEQSIRIEFAGFLDGESLFNLDYVERFHNGWKSSQRSEINPNRISCNALRAIVANLYFGTLDRSDLHVQDYIYELQWTDGPTHNLPKDRVGAQSLAEWANRSEFPAFTDTMRVFITNKDSNAAWVRSNISINYVTSSEDDSVIEELSENKWLNLRQTRRNFLRKLHKHWIPSTDQGEKKISYPIMFRAILNLENANTYKKATITLNTQHIYYWCYEAYEPEIGENLENLNIAVNWTESLNE